MKNTITTEVTSSRGSMDNARLWLVLIIRIRLPIISSGARVPIRNEICTRRCTALESLVRRTINWPVCC